MSVCVYIQLVGMPQKRFHSTHTLSFEIYRSYIEGVRQGWMCHVVGSCVIGYISSLSER